MHVAFVYAFHHDLLYPVTAVYWGRVNKHGATEDGKLAICINLLFMLSYYVMRRNSINDRIAYTTEIQTIIARRDASWKERANSSSVKALILGDIILDKEGLHPRAVVSFPGR